MTIQIINSSALVEADYDVESHTLTVEFTSGKRYKYHGVPDTVNKKFMKASSKGTFFANRIRDIYHSEEL